MTNRSGAIPDVWAGYDDTPLFQPYAPVAMFALKMVDAVVGETPNGMRVQLRRGTYDDVCGMRKVDADAFCCMWPGHDGPHLAHSERLARAMGRVAVVVGMSRVRHV